MTDRRLHPVVARVTQAIIDRSRDRRAAYLAQVEAARGAEPGRAKLSSSRQMERADSDRGVAIGRPDLV